MERVPASSGRGPEPPAWELPYATGAALKRHTHKKGRKNGNPALPPYRPLSALAPGFSCNGPSTAPSPRGRVAEVWGAQPLGRWVTREAGGEGRSSYCEARKQGVSTFHPSRWRKPSLCAPRSGQELRHPVSPPPAAALPGGSRGTSMVRRATATKHHKLSDPTRF